MSTGASFARGASKQDYSTPAEFIAAVKHRFRLHDFDFDLAATKKNAKAKKFFSPEADALKRNWTTRGWRLWLNPPFDRIEPWAEKCVSSTRAWCRIYFLVPAAVGSNWFATHVHERAHVYFLNGRLSFDGKNPYPKDCLLAVYGAEPGYTVWPWKKELP